MSMDQARRLAIVEAAFRVANHRMANWEERHRDRPQELYFCECAARDCRMKIRLSKEEYDAVRRNPQWFVVRPGHDLPEIETVVESYATYAVIEKPDALLEFVVASDPSVAEDTEPARQARAIAQEIESDPLP